MTPAEVVQLIRRYRLAVVSAVVVDGSPQAAAVGFAINARQRLSWSVCARWAG